MTALPDPFAPRKHRWVIWLWVLLFVGAFVLLPLCLFVGYYHYEGSVQDERLSKAVARTDALDPGWRLEELEAKRVTLRDEENGALLILAARKLLPGSWQEGAFDKARQNQPPPFLLNDDQANKLRTKLAEAAPALAKARQLKNVSFGRFPLTYSFNYFGVHRDSYEVWLIAKLLEADALHRAHVGNVDGACDSCRAILNAGRAVGDEPALIPMLWRTNIHAFAVQSLEQTFALGEPSASSLVAVKDLIESELDEPLVLSGLRGVRAGFHDVNRKVEAGQLAVTQVIPDGGSKSPQGMERVENLWVVPRVTQGHAEWLNAITDAVEVAKLPVDEQKPLLAKILVRRTWMTPYAKLLLSESLSPAVTGFSISQARLRCALVAIALERYRRQRGRWPERLADLRGEFLTDVPLDPFDGQPLRYRKDGQGVIVYSVRKDEKDNGGDRETLNTYEDGTDLGFRLWDVEKRRQRQK